MISPCNQCVIMVYCLLIVSIFPVDCKGEPIMEFIKRKAWDMRLKNHIYHLSLSLEDMVNIALNHGWDLYSYQGAQELLNHLQLEVYAKLLRAFSIMDGDLKIILYQDELSYSQKLFSIAHEFGHIYLHHSFFGIMGDSEDRSVANAQEKEADLFAFELLMPSCILSACRIKTLDDLKVLHLLNPYYEKTYMETVYAYKKFRLYDPLYQNIWNFYQQEIKTIRAEIKLERRKKWAQQHLPHDFPIPFAIGAISAAMIATFLLCVAIRSENSIDLLKNISHSPYLSNDWTSSAFLNFQQDPSKIEVYVTEDGKKYHRATCQHIKGKKIRKITLKEALEEGYKPCEICNP